MQVCAFQKYRSIVQEMKFYSLASMKDQLSVRLFPNKSLMMNEIIKKTNEKYISLHTTEPNIPLLKIIQRKIHLNNSKINHYFMIWKNEIIRIKIMEYKNILSSILDEVKGIEENAIISERNISELSQNIDSIFELHNI